MNNFRAFVADVMWGCKIVVLVASPVMYFIAGNHEMALYLAVLGVAL